MGTKLLSRILKGTEKRIAQETQTKMEGYDCSGILKKSMVVQTGFLWDTQGLGWWNLVNKQILLPGRWLYLTFYLTLYILHIYIYIYIYIYIKADLCLLSRRGQFLHYNNQSMCTVWRDGRYPLCEEEKDEYFILRKCKEIKM